MNIGQIKSKLQELVTSRSKDTFAYGLPKASIIRLNKGIFNLSKIAGEIIWEIKLCSRTVQDEYLHGGNRQTGFLHIIRT